MLPRHRLLLIVRLATLVALPAAHRISQWCLPLPFP